MVRDRDGHLAIAKFPDKGEEINAVLWEAAALTLAAKAGIPVPVWRLEEVARSRCCCCGVSIGTGRSGCWRRIVFNILISNTDDHLRNHGFLYPGPEGWRLSPAYDFNPVPVDIKPRVLSTAIDLDDGTASLELAMDVAGYFELESRAARGIALEVGKAVAKWRRETARLGLPAVEMDRMASAFEHEDLAAALGKSQERNRRQRSPAVPG